MYPIEGCMQTLLWVKEVEDFKGLQVIQSPLNTQHMAKVLNLNAFQRKKHSPVGHGVYHTPRSNTPDISLIFITCLAPEDIWIYTR